jgi:hypothetical protein
MTVSENNNFLIFGIQVSGYVIKPKMQERFNFKIKKRNESLAASPEKIK